MWANGKQIATYDAQGLHYYFDDPLGTRRAQANAAGVLEATYQSLPFGDGFASTGNDDPTENHFTGKERDAESGNDYMFARYYNSATGRFLSPDWDAKSSDPVPYAKLDDPQSLNLYSYVRNNPVEREDPDGHVDGTTADGWFGIASSGALSFGEGMVSTAVAPIVAIGAGLAYIFSPPSLNNDPDEQRYINSLKNAPPTAGDKASPKRPGTKGLPDHQATADEEAAKLGATGQREVPIQTPGGQKGSRRIDAANVDKNGKITNPTQVIRPNKDGSPPKREVDAARDIEKALPGQKVKFVPVRPVPPQQ